MAAHGLVHGTVGIADVCAPSWAGRSERDITYLNHWLDKVMRSSPPIIRVSARAEAIPI
jgi:hypothetical protein